MYRLIGHATCKKTELSIVIVRKILVTVHEFQNAGDDPIELTSSIYMAVC